MQSRSIRFLAAVVAFGVLAYVGITYFGRFEGEFDPNTFAIQAAADVFALILAIALLVAALVYLGIEYLQTRRLDSVASQFDTRTIVLIPLAIAINIILGTTVAAALKIPIYLDSIGTILVGVLAGPIAGAATGFLGNLLWSYVVPPPFQYPPAAAFAVVAAVIGLLAGIFGRVGMLRPRPDRPTTQLVIAGFASALIIAAMAYLAYLGYSAIIGPTGIAPQSDNPIFQVLGYVALLLVVGTVIGLFALLIIRRDLTASYVVLAGVVTGIIAALISAPIAASVFGGVTGAGSDFLVAAFRQAGSDINAATLGQGLISDPIDKVTTFFVVYLILTAMARRTKARFPQGEKLVERGEFDDHADGDLPGAPA